MLFSFAYCVLHCREYFCFALLAIKDFKAFAFWGKKIGIWDFRFYLGDFKFGILKHSQSYCSQTTGKPELFCAHFLTFGTRLPAFNIKDL